MQTKHLIEVAAIGASLLPPCQLPEPKQHNDPWEKCMTLAFFFKN